jgi:hypothetical protein
MVEPSSESWRQNTLREGRVGGLPAVAPKKTIRAPGAATSTSYSKPGPPALSTMTEKGPPAARTAACGHAGSR